MDYSTEQELMKIWRKLKCLQPCLGISPNGDPTLFLNQQGDWVSTGGSISGDANQVLYFDFTGNIASDAGFTRDVLGATTKIYADESSIFGGIFLNGAVGQFGYSNNSIALNNYYFADSGNLGWTIGANTWTLPTTDGSLGDILTTNGLGQLSWTTPGGGGLTFDNGLTETAGNVQLGGTLIQTTDIDADGELFTISNTYADYISGNNGLFTTNWIRKDISPTLLTATGLIDLSGFGQDSNTVVIGNLDLLGNPTTRIFLQPTTGTVRLDSTDDTIFTVGADFITNVGANFNVNVENDITLDTNTGDVNINSAGLTTLSGVGNTFIDSQSYVAITANNGITTAGNNKSAISLNPYDTTPSLVIEAQNLQNYAYGFAGLDDSAGSGKIYSNIYYGSLDVGNNITDITRVEASNTSANIRYVNSPTLYNGVSAHNTYSQLEYQKTSEDGQGTGNTFTLDSNGFRAFVSGTPVLIIGTDGNLTTTAAEIKKVRTANYGSPLTFTTTDYHLALEGAGTGGTTIDISGMTVGQIAVISDLDFKSGANNITIDTGTGNTICSLTGVAQTYIISTNGESATVQRISATKFKMI